MPVTHDESSAHSSGRPPRRRLLRRTVAAATAVIAAGALLAACSGDSSGRVTLNFYQVNDPSGAIGDAVKDCSTSQYDINYNILPASADQQREQLVQRLAAQDPTIDIMGLDVTWEAEFAEAGWIEPWTGADKASVENGTLKAALNTATWKGQLVAAPFTSNTQLLWYRGDLVKTPPTTWTEMINDAIKLKAEGKPHLIEIQGAQYEGTTVWFNTMVNSAGGTILNSKNTGPGLGTPAVKALTIMKRLASSSAADPSLAVQMEDSNRLAMESGTAAFELNYPYVYPSMQSDNPKVKTYNGKSLAENFKYALYPRVVANKPAKVTIGGIDLGVSSYSQHKSFAFKAALCLRNKTHELEAAVKGGLPPTIQSLYTNPSKAFTKAYPFYKQIYQALKTASVRPKTPAYQNVSIVISHAVSPPGGIDPKSTESTISGQITDALESKGLIP